MKSTNKKKQFTIEDFEKGLMLAGYISPKNTTEIKEREALQKYDKEQAKQKKELYFKRAVLAAEIVNQLKDENTFGRIKFQKLVYLCENAMHMNIPDGRYQKFAAGPFDNKFMHSIYAEFKKQKWYGVLKVTEGKFTKPKYHELNNHSKYKVYYNRYFSDQDRSIQKIIELFRNERTHFTELVATIFYCWKEINDNNEVFTMELLYDRFYKWAEEKSKFSKTEINNAINWMKIENIVPID